MARRDSSGPGKPVPEKWRSLLLQIPGYDPVATAGDAWFDADAAQLALDFFPECLQHVEGALAGQPFKLEPWQQAVLANLFGWKRKDELGRVVRRYRESLIFVARKNGKTPWMAGLALFVLVCDDEAGQQNFLGAESKDQAGKLFRYCKGMVERDPDMKARLRIYGGHAAEGQSRSIVRESDLSFLKVISGEAPGEHGGNTHLAVIDELHAQPNRELVDVIQTSFASQNRKQPLFILITTSDYARPSICNEKYDYACKVRDGIIVDPAFLPVIYEAKPEMSWTDPETWKAANPNLGVSVSREYLERECKRAQETPSYENTFKRLHLNLRTEQDIRWIQMEQWARCGEPFDVEMLNGQDCWLGIDFGWRDDYAALAAVFKAEDVFYCLSKFWLPRGARRDKRLPPTADFIAAGLVTLTDGDSTDIEAIYAQVKEWAGLYGVQGIALDPNNARKQSQDLMAEGFAVTDFFQSKKNYNEPCRFMEALLKEGRLRHGGNKVLTWMASNAVAEMDGLGQIMPKKKLSNEKIDGICAMTMGLGLAMMVGETGSVYDKPGSLAL